MPSKLMKMGQLFVQASGNQLHHPEQAGAGCMGPGYVYGTGEFPLMFLADPLGKT
jgi:hypothetical protein